MLREAVSCEAELNVHELTAIPDPKEHCAPLWKLLPVTTIVAFWPCTPELGLTNEIEGEAAIPGRSISTQAKSAVIWGPLRLAPVTMANLGLLSACTKLPIAAQLAPESTE